MYLSKTPEVLHHLHQGLTWKIKDSPGQVYLTFDDGPHPEITPWVLEQLKAHDAKATFFCVGNNVDKHPDIVQLVRDGGHEIGNHTFHHVSGWKTENRSYFKEVAQCQELVDARLFRPPYGKIKPSQIKVLKEHYNIVMWDVLSCDFDANLNGDDCVNKVIKSVTDGSIIVFHDSEKAWPRLEIALPTVLNLLSSRGYKFGLIKPLTT